MSRPEHVQSAAWWYRQARESLHSVGTNLIHATWCERHAPEWVASTWYCVLVDLCWALHWRAVARAVRAGVPVHRWPALPEALQPPGHTRGERVATYSERPRPGRLRAATLRARRRADREARRT